MKKIMGLVLGAVLTVTSIGAVISVSAAETEFPDLFENKIGIIKAVEMALEDAGLTEDQAEFTKLANVYSDGQHIYDIHFINRGDTKYEYHLDAFTGEILERDHELWEVDDDLDYQALADAGQEFFSTDEEILKVFDEAFQTALTDAGLDAADVIVYKYGVSYDDGRVVFDAGFIVPGEMEYDYDIDLVTGKITDMDKDLWEADDDAEYKNLLTPPAKDAAAAPAAADETDPKQIALKDAGFAEADVQMIKCVKDIDDGVEVFEVEFIGPDGMKYDYDIRVSDGMITNKDVELDD